jgi:hypothetical protein
MPANPPNKLPLILAISAGSSGPPSYRCIGATNPHKFCAKIYIKQHLALVHRDATPLADA